MYQRPKTGESFWAYQPGSRTLHVHNLVEPFVVKPHKPNQKAESGNCLLAVGLHNPDLWFKFDLQRWRLLPCSKNIGGKE